MTVSVLDLLDDLATRPYLALAAVVLAVLALAAVVVLMLRTGTLRRRLRALEHEAGGTTAAEDVTRAPLGAGSRSAARPTTGGATGAVPVEPVLRRTASAPHAGPTAGDDTAAALDGAPQDGAPQDGTVHDDGPHDGREPRWPALAADAGSGGPVAGHGVPVDAAGQHSAGGDAVQLAATAALREVTLLGRQLELLDGLEQREEAPEVLAVLFQLDNLTMRLRRQAESVLVLAGRESGRRARDPLSVADVVRTACAQIDGYERVAVDPATDAELSAAAVVPAAHLVAELLENALRFSDPATQVDVRIDAADDGGATIAIADAGLGMDDATLADARARLDAGAAAPGGGRIGLAVVGRIARRHGLTVHLDPGPRGTTATVHVPARLLTGAGSGAWTTVAPAGPTGATDLGVPTDLDGPADLGGPADLDVSPAPGDVEGPTEVPVDPLRAWDGFTEPPVLPQEEFAPALDVVDAPLTRRSVRAPAAPEPATTRDTPVVGFAPTGGADAPGHIAPVDGTALPEPRSSGFAPTTPAAPWAPTSDGPAPVPEWPAMTPGPAGPPGTSLPATGFAPDASGAGSAPFGSGTGFAPAAPVVAPAPAGSVSGIAPAGPTTAFAPAAPTTGSVPTVPTTGSAPAVPTTGFAPATAAADGWFVPAGGVPATAAGDAGLRDEVLAELGRLSGYSPARVASEPAPALERRTATAVVEPLAANRGPSDRDAGTVRRRFAAFQSATGRSRGRQR